MAFKKVDPDKEWKIVNRLYNGESRKKVAWDEGYSISTIDNIYNDFPLFTWRSKDDY